jgi:hypothetical protein
MIGASSAALWQIMARCSPNSRLGTVAAGRTRSERKSSAAEFFGWYSQDHRDRPDEPATVHYGRVCRCTSVASASSTAPTRRRPNGSSVGTKAPPVPTAAWINKPTTTEEAAQRGRVRRDRSARASWRRRREKARWLLAGFDSSEAPDELAFRAIESHQRTPRRVALGRACSGAGLGSLNS